MAVSKTKMVWAAGESGYYGEFILDTEADVPNLPDCCPGSSALVVATGNVYMVNASCKWVLFGGDA